LRVPWDDSFLDLALKHFFAAAATGSEVASAAGFGALGDLNFTSALRVGATINLTFLQSHKASLFLDTLFKFKEICLNSQRLLSNFIGAIFVN
jgi:hypothetical protein